MHQVKRASGLPALAGIGAIQIAGAVSGDALVHNGTEFVPTAGGGGGGTSHADVQASLVVRAASTANLALAGAQTIDGVACVAGDRVLVKDQAVASQNGVYVVAAGAWSRATDADAAAELLPGRAVAVSEGTVNADSLWMLTTSGPITVGTTGLVFDDVPVTKGRAQTITGAKTFDANIHFTANRSLTYEGDLGSCSALSCSGSNLTIGDAAPSALSGDPYVTVQAYGALTLYSEAGTVSVENAAGSHLRVTANGVIQTGGATLDAPGVAGTLVLPNDRALAGEVAAGGAALTIAKVTATDAVEFGDTANDSTLKGDTLALLGGSAVEITRGSAKIQLTSADNVQVDVPTGSFFNLSADGFATDLLYADNSTVDALVPLHAWEGAQVSKQGAIADNAVHDVIKAYVFPSTDFVAGCGVGITLSAYHFPASTEVQLARLQAVATVATAGSEAGALDLQTRTAPGSLTTRLRVWGDGGVTIGNTTASPVPGSQGFLGLPNGSNNGIAFRNSSDSAWINVVQLNSTSFTIGSSNVSPFLIGGSQINFRIGSSTTYMQLTAGSLALGTGDLGASPTGFKLYTARGGGTNIPGTTLTLTGGLGTGTGASGKVDLAVGQPQASGTSQHVETVAERLEYPSTAEDTTMWLLVNRGGTVSLSRVTLGAADSGGAGKRALVVAN
jgi:hypothetical protein